MDHPFFWNEKQLRDYVALRPQLVSSGQKAATVATEVDVPSTGRADVVVVSAAGDITIVECKLRAKPESHGAAIGQSLSYAAGFSTLSFDEFKRRIEGHRASRVDSSMAELDWNDADLRVNVDHSLREGRFRLIIAVDGLSTALRGTLLFTGEHPMPEVRFGYLELQPAELLRHGAAAPFPLLIRRIEALSSPAARVAEALLDWGRLQPALNSRCEWNLGVVEIIAPPRRRTLFKINHGEIVRVSLGNVARDLGDSAIHELERGLEGINFTIKGGKARTRLESLDAGAFLALMERVTEQLGLDGGA